MHRHGGSNHLRFAAEQIQYWTTFEAGVINLVQIKNNNIIEIGPGKGALTDQILGKEPSSLTLIEKDNLLSKHLELKYKTDR